MFVTAELQDIEIDSNQIVKAKLKCEIYLNNKVVSTLQMVDDTLNKTTLPIQAMQDRIRFVLRDRDSNYIIGCISFSPSVFIAAKGRKVAHWITLFDSFEDDEYDGDLIEDDDEKPRILFHFSVDEMKDEELSVANPNQENSRTINFSADEPEIQTHIVPEKVLDELPSNSQTSFADYDQECKSHKAEKFHLVVENELEAKHEIGSEMKGEIGKEKEEFNQNMPKNGHARQENSLELEEKAALSSNKNNNELSHNNDVILSQKAENMNGDIFEVQFSKQHLQVIPELDSMNTIASAPVVEEQSHSPYPLITEPISTSFSQNEPVVTKQNDKEDIAVDLKSDSSLEYPVSLEAVNLKKHSGISVSSPRDAERVLT